MTNKIRVLIVDDDKLVTQSIKTIIEMDPELQVVGLGNSAREACNLYEELKPDVLLMDIRMGEETGLQAAKKIIASDDSAKILILTTFSDDEYIKEAISIGVKGYLIKQDFDKIIPAIKTTAGEQSIFDSEVIGNLSKLINQTTIKQTENSPELTGREHDILLLVADGKNNREIAAELFLSEGTVRNYISRMLEKYNLRDRTQLAIFYYRNYES